MRNNKLQLFTNYQVHLHEEYMEQRSIQVLKRNHFKECKGYISSLINKDEQEDIQDQVDELQKLGFKATQVAGKGSFGNVLIGEDDEKESFAFKFIFILNKRGKINEEVKLMALKEVEVMKRLDHPNVVKYFNHFQTNSYIVIQMEQCRGTFDELLSENEFLSIQSFLKYGLEMVEGIKYIHSQGLILRDLKPDNILINQLNIIKISDFGLAANVEVGTSFVKYSIAGAQLYRAPELQPDICSNFVQKLKQVDKNLLKQSTKSDIFSLGLIFFKILGSKSLDFLKIITEGPSSVGQLLMLQDEQELQVLHQMLQNMCESHPNKRWKIDQILQTIQKLHEQILPNFNAIPDPCKLIKLSNETFFIETDFEIKHKEKPLDPNLFPLNSKILDFSVIQQVRNEIQPFHNINNIQTNFFNNKIKKQQNIYELIHSIQVQIQVIKYEKAQYNNYQQILTQFQKTFLNQIHEVLKYPIQNRKVNFLSFHKVYAKLLSFQDEVVQLLKNSKSQNEYGYITGRINQILGLDSNILNQDILKSLQLYYFLIENFFELLEKQEELVKQFYNELRKKQND